MSGTQIQSVSEKINLLIGEVEDSLGYEAGNPFVDALYREEIILEEAQKDLSDAINNQIGKLQARGFKNSHIIKLLVGASKAQFETLGVVENEIASVILKKIEIAIPSEITRLVGGLTDDEFRVLRARVKAPYKSKEARSLIIDCTFDRWVLVVDEDKFIESALMAIKIMDFE